MYLLERRCSKVCLKPAFYRSHSASSLQVMCFIFLALTICKTAQGQEYYGIKINADHVVFLLDVSGSMEDKDEGVIGSEATSRLAGKLGGVLGRRVGGKIGNILADRVRSETTKLGAARRELIQALNGLESDSQFTIFKFGDGVAQWPGGFRNVGTATRRLAQGYVAQLSAKGGTPMGAALEAAYAIKNAQVIFLVSDGRPTDTSGPMIVGRLASLDKGRNIVVNTVGIGPDQDSDLLCSLARGTGGFYVRDGKVACHGGVCNDPETRALFNTGPNSNYHQYNKELTICSRKKSQCCTVQNVYKIMLSQMRFVAPTTDTSPVTNCKLTVLPVNNPIRTVVNTDAHSIENYTKVGHIFHPGRVVRTVAEVQGKVVVRTYGEGNGDWGWWNKELFSGVWPEAIDPQIWLQDLFSSCNKG